ncbi:hypothetical protein NHX12_006383 [Muraenolepis orangiensis]|uniref:Uncharacterized protein n=1 Tax=Muraenolepis orangiensis TaxID=630683 RepID=A0A9Q0DT82_9TELE|nr:hypothetical protein NHX12_006383 [Muraenolepis orangiensis]
MLLQEQEAAYSDLLQHNDVRWLSRGRVLERFFALRKEVSEFLSSQKSSKAKDQLARMQKPDFIAQIAFLCDIMGHLNTLNLQLQGRGSSVAEIIEKVCVFRVNLDLFLPDVMGRKIHFPTLRNVPVSSAAMAGMKGLLKSLAENFTERFNDFKIPKQVILFVRNPFAVDVSGSCPAEAKAVMPVVLSLTEAFCPGHPQDGVTQVCAQGLSLGCSSDSCKRNQCALPFTCVDL